MGAKKPQWLGSTLLIATCVFAINYSVYVFETTPWQNVGTSAATVIVVQTLIEIVASFFALGSLLSVIVYLRSARDMALPCHFQKGYPDGARVAIVYLCCDDFDEDAFRTLTTLEYDGPLCLVVHDDSRSLTSQRLVDRVVADCRSASGIDIHLLRRPERKGGKPGALNYVLERSAHLHDFFLLCDNDTTIVDRSVLPKALPAFADPHVAIAQCRSVSTGDAETPGVNRILCRAIDVFHLFLWSCSRYGWSLFIGHNAILRTSAVMEAGGLTPDFFADDLDLTVRLNRCGYHVRYLADIKIGEKHPSNYLAFRKRTYKWSYGCVQMLRTHSRTVLADPHFSIAEKLSFFFFNGFYVCQSVLLLYTILTFLVAPLLHTMPHGYTAQHVVVGCLAVTLVYLPTLAYFWRAGELRRSLLPVVACGLVYGAADFVCVKGVWDGVRRRRTQWVPTNTVSNDVPQAAVLGEAAFSLLLFGVVAAAAPDLLYIPSTYLFVGKFLFTPCISAAYGPSAEELHIETEGAAA
jgi:GT2 family glycosyltransferase